jgi:antitoxin PrlF
MKAFDTSSALTDRFQTTVPEPVRKALSLHKRDRIVYQILESGDVLMTRAADTEADPAIGQFLQFLEHEIMTNPARLQPLAKSHLAVLAELVGDFPIDLDYPLDPNDE